MNIQPQYHTTGVVSTSIRRFISTPKVGSVMPKMPGPIGEYSTVRIVSGSAMKNLVRMLRSIVAAIPGSDMS